MTIMTGLPHHAFRGTTTPEYGVWTTVEFRTPAACQDTCFFLLGPPVPAEQPLESQRLPFATNVANLVTSSKARSTERSVLRLLAPSSKSALLRLHLIIAVMRLLQWIVMRILTRLLNPRQTTKSRFSKSWFFIDSVDTLPILLEKFYTQKRLF